MNLESQLGDLRPGGKKEDIQLPESSCSFLSYVPPPLAFVVQLINDDIAVLAVRPHHIPYATRLRCLHLCTH